MNQAIKTLEEIGRNTSLKHYDNTDDMLNHLEIDKLNLTELNLNEYVCLLVPEDDNDDKDDDSDEGESE